MSKFKTGKERRRRRAVHARRERREAKAALACVEAQITTGEDMDAIEQAALSGKPLDEPPRAQIGRKQLALMRSASTKANYSHGMGGLPRKIHKPAPITLPKMPWDEEKPENAK